MFAPHNQIFLSNERRKVHLKKVSTIEEQMMKEQTWSSSMEEDDKKEAPRPGAERNQIHKC